MALLYPNNYREIQPKAIFFDIDGTLVSFKTKSVPESTKTSIHQLKEKGVKVIISTGRALNCISNLDDLEFDGYITLNGTICLDSTRKIIAQHPIPKESLGKLSLFLEEKPFPCVFVTNKEIFINCINEQIQPVYQLINLPIPPVKDIAEIMKHDIFQISAFMDSELETEFLDHVLTGCDSARWHPAFTDFNVKHISKATGMDELMTYFGIEGQSTMAFGDGGNDISMLKHATMGIAMGNAADHVKTVAGYVTDSVDDDGIVNALKYFHVFS